MKTFTRAGVLSWRPCCGENETLRIMKGLPRKMTALHVLRHEAATPEDRLWCVLRTGVLSDRTLRMFAAWCARTALDTMRTAGREPDPRSWAAVETAERYALGQATEDELRDARAAAYAVAAYAYAAAYGAPAAADAAAYAASCDAAADAYDAAAYAAAAAARAVYAVAARAAYAAAADAASAAARAAQVGRLIQIIEENER